MASKSPLQKLQDALVETVKGAITHPRDTAAKAGEQAKGTISLGKAVAGQVTKSAAGVVASRLPGHRSTTGTPRRTSGVEVPRSRAETPPAAPPETQPAAPAARQPTPTKPPVTDLATDLVKRQAASRPASKPASKPAPVNPIDAAADAVQVEATPADLARKATSAQRASAKKTSARPTAKTAPAKKAAAKKPAGQQAAAKRDSTPSDRLPPRKRVSAPDAEKS